MNLYLGFSYIGLIFLLMLIIPNIIWSKNKPKNYEEYVKKENKILLLFEKIGEALVVITSLIFSGSNIKDISTSSTLLLIALIIMILYEIYWIRYFKSNKTMKDMYTSILKIPVAGATLPVISFLLLGVYSDNCLLIISTIILGIGHIGIHLKHLKELEEINIKKQTLKIILLTIGILGTYFIGNLAYKIYQLNKLEKMSSYEMIKYDTKNDEAKISVATIKNGNIEYKIYGKNMKEEQKIYDYEIGSISKTYLALLLSKTINENKINMKDSINKYLNLGDNKYYPTIERLITHTSGYKPYYFNKKMITNKFIQKNDYYGINKQEILNKIKTTKLEDKDYDFEYSNFGISVLGLVLENVYNKDFNTLMNEFIKEELKLKNTEVALKNGNLDNYWNWEKDDGYIPAGAIISNIKDMAEYLEIYLKSDEEYITNLYNPIKEVTIKNYMYDKLDININKVAMSWMIDTKNNFVWHNGGTSNYNSYIAFNKEKNIGVVILSNLGPNERIPATVIGGKMMKELCN